MLASTADEVSEHVDEVFDDLAEEHVEQDRDLVVLDEVELVVVETDDDDDDVVDDVVESLDKLDVELDDDDEVVEVRLDVDDEVEDEEDGVEDVREHDDELRVLFVDERLLALEDSVAVAEIGADDKRANLGEPTDTMYVCD